MSVIAKETAVEMYRRMLLIRRFEEKLFFLFSTRSMPGTMHQYNGEEAVAVGMCTHLNIDDYITSTHRGHGHCLAKGTSTNGVMAEMFAKSTGCCKGMGGSMHIADFGVGMLGANGIVGAGLPIAVGAAWSCKYQKNGKVAAAFFGDGASNEGAFHEAINLAAIWKLPIVFVCENNLYGFSTYYGRSTPVKDIAVRAASYGIEGAVVDGMNVEEVYEACGTAVERARKGEGPTLIECKTYRFMGHSRAEKPTYRTQEEVDKWRKKDPIPSYGEVLKSKYGLTEVEIKNIEISVTDEIDSAVRFAEKSPRPQPEDYKKYIFA